jgi:nicotinamide-nucleotide amidase
MHPLVAEVIAIGDEIVSGQRLDTNSQWISQQLHDLGVRVRYHSTVGDELDSGIACFQIAKDRANLIVATGGLGPTADDLTRHVVAKVAGVPLIFHGEVLESIRGFFAARGRTMPENNRAQALFPAGSRVLPNAEGTAPGFDLRFGDSCRLFALPGVPAELKPMWFNSVRDEVRSMSGNNCVIRHHVIHCFGAGESQIEMMLPNLIQRDRKPLVGITASSATITLRIAAIGENEEQCADQIEQTAKVIRHSLGNLVFGEGDDDLEQAVVRLLDQCQLTIGIADFSFGGGVAKALHDRDPFGKRCVAGIALPPHRLATWALPKHVGQPNLIACAMRVRNEHGSDMGVAIGPPETVAQDGKPRSFECAIAMKDGNNLQKLEYVGPSAILEVRATKQVLNHIRLTLMKYSPVGSQSTTAGIVRESTG